MGAHALHTREADSALIAQSTVYVDSLSSTLAEGGDIMIPIEEGCIDHTHIQGELGAVIAGAVAGRQREDEITVYNSLGITIQDLHAAHYVIRQAQQTGEGVRVD